MVFVIFFNNFNTCVIKLPKVKQEYTWHSFLKKLSHVQAAVIWEITKKSPRNFQHRCLVTFKAILHIIKWLKTISGNWRYFCLNFWLQEPIFALILPYITKNLIYFSSANRRLARTKLYSSNQIAISVNRSDWHFESNRSVRKYIPFIEMVDKRFQLDRTGEMECVLLHHCYVNHSHEFRIVRGFSSDWY